MWKQTHDVTYCPPVPTCCAGRWDAIGDTAARSQDHTTNMANKAQCSPTIEFAGAIQATKQEHDTWYCPVRRLPWLDGLRNAARYLHPTQRAHAIDRWRHRNDATLWRELVRLCVFVGCSRWLRELISSFACLASSCEPARHASLALTINTKLVVGKSSRQFSDQAGGLESFKEGPLSGRALFQKRAHCKTNLYSHSTRLNDTQMLSHKFILSPAEQTTQQAYCK